MRVTGAVTAAALVLAGCSSGEPTAQESYPFADYDAMAWYEETLAEQRCPFPDLPDEPCEARTALRVKEVVLQPGTVLENYEWDLPDDQSVAPPEQVTITEQQSVWCFVDRQYERSLDYLELGEERVRYSYPCFSLGPDPNKLEHYVGELQPDGTVQDLPTISAPDWLTTEPTW